MEIEWRKEVCIVPSPHAPGWRHGANFATSVAGYDARVTEWAEGWKQEVWMGPTRIAPREGCEGRYYATPDEAKAAAVKILRRLILADIGVIMKLIEGDTR